MSLSNPATRARVGLASLALLLCAFAALPAAAQMVEGKNYQRMATPVPVETGNKIEVIEFFSFGCPHCADLEPILDGWLAKKPADVEFRRIPVSFQKAWENLAKVYYTLHVLGQDELAPKVFDAIHKNNKNLADPKTFFDWAASNGMDRKKVEDMYNSFSIASDISRSKRQAQQFNIESVPTVIVDGKFITSSDRIGGHANVPSAIDALVAKARAERGKG